MNLLIDAMDKASRWTALKPDLVTPSTDLTLSDDKTVFQFGDDQTSGRIQGTTQAQGNVLRRDLANLNLSALEEIRLWGRSDRRADGSAEAPFFLDLKLASATMGFDDPNNTWRRPLPFFNPGNWELIRVNISELRAEIRAAAGGMQLKCLDATQPFTCNLDTCLAVQEEMLADVEAELVARTDKQVAVAGAPLGAVIFNPDLPQPAMPYIRITPYEVTVNEERSVIATVKMDYTETGFRVLGQRIGFDLVYDFDVYSSDRQAKTRVFEFLLRAFAPRSELVVNGVPLIIELVSSLQADYVTPERVDRTPVRFKIQTWQAKSAGDAPTKRPFAKISVEGEPSLAGIGA